MCIKLSNYDDIYTIHGKKGLLIMNGFNIYTDNDYIKSFQNGAGSFNLFAQEKDLEVFESIINPGKSIICQPYESKDSINIMIILEGKMFHTNERRFIKSGDRITFKNLEETHHISVLEKTRLLMIRNSVHFVNQAGNTDIVYELIHQIQEKDHYTEIHCNDSGNLALQIATLMKLSDQQITNVGHAAKIHDVGKINTPIEILNKPSSLTYEEYELVKKHPQDGYNLVIESTGLADIAKIILDHHERLDGSGYPNGLKGNELSIESRILAVVDSFDAMISKRPYKDPISIEDAIEDLKIHIGTWYDKEVVEALIEIMSFTSDFYRR